MTHLFRYGTSSKIRICYTSVCDFEMTFFFLLYFIHYHRWHSFFQVVCIRVYSVAWYYAWVVLFNEFWMLVISNISLWLFVVFIWLLLSFKIFCFLFLCLYLLSKWFEEGNADLASLVDSSPS